MLRVNNLKISLDAGPDAPLEAALKKIKAPKDQVLSWRISKKSVDARDKGDVHFVMAVDLKLRKEEIYLRAAKPGTVNQVSGISAPCALWWRVLARRGFLRR